MTIAWPDGEFQTDEATNWAIVWDIYANSSGIWIGFPITACITLKVSDRIEQYIIRIGNCRKASLGTADIA